MNASCVGRFIVLAGGILDTLFRSGGPSGLHCRGPPSCWNNICIVRRRSFSPGLQKGSRPIVLTGNQNLFGFPGGPWYETCFIYQTELYSKPIRTNVGKVQVFLFGLCFHDYMCSHVLYHCTIAPLCSLPFGFWSFFFQIGDKTSHWNDRKPVKNQQKFPFNFLTRNIQPQ